MSLDCVPSTAAPMHLKQVLARHRLSQRQLVGGLRTAGLQISGATLNLLVNKHQWPARRTPEEVQEKVLTWLRRHKVPERDLIDVFEPGPPDVEAPPDPGGERGGAGEDEPLPERAMLSQAARKTFRLHRDPFQDDVNGPEDVFLSSDQRYIREAMYSAARHGGLLAVVGESGAGKSVLRRDLLDRVRREGAHISVIQPRTIDKERLTGGAICDAIIGDLSQEGCRRSLEAKARQVERLLTGSSRAGNSHVLVIEEAHDLSIPTLKYLKRFWEMEDGFKRLLAIVLIGQPELKAKLDERQNWSAREFIRRCEVAELLPLDDQVEPYLGLKFKRVGLDAGGVFEPDAYAAVRERLTLRRRNGGPSDVVSMCFPLVVNNLVVRAMNLAADVGATRVSGELVREA